MPRSKARRRAELKSSCWMTGRSAVSTMWMRRLRGSCRSRLARAMLNVGLPRVRMPISSAAVWSNMVPLSRPFTIANPAGLVKAGRRTTDDRRLRPIVYRPSSIVRLFAVQDVDHVAVFDHVAFAFEAQQAALFGFGDAAAGHQVGVGDDLGANEPALEVAVDDAGRLGRERALADGPGAHLVRPRGQEADQPQQAVGLGDHVGQGRGAEGEGFAELGGVLRRKLAD